MEKVSIVLPVYNSDSTLEKCIKSIINQSYKNIEIIIINDGSIDDSIKIIEDLKRKDERIKVLNKKNEGVSKARNDGISIASGKYIQFVDADDILEENITYELVKVLEKNDVDLAFCGYKIEYIDKKIVEFYGIANSYQGKPKDLIENLFNESLLFMIWNKLYKKDLIKNDFNEELSLGEDALFNLEYLKRCNRICSVNLPLYCYRLSRSSGLHLKFSMEDYKTDVLLYKKIKEITPNTLVSENIYLDSVQRTIQRMIFTSKLSKKDEKMLIKRAINNSFMVYALNNNTFEGIQHRLFVFLFKKQWITILIVIMKLKKFLLKLIRR